MSALSRHTRLNFFIACVAAFVFSLAQAVVAEETPRGESPYLFGDWNGARRELADKGLEIESIVTADLVSNFTGDGKHRTESPFNYDLTLSFDTTKGALWEGGTFFLYVLGNTGRAPAALSEVIQTTDNIVTDEDLKLYEAWYQQEFASGEFSLLLGLYDYNSEFYALDYASSLINSSFGIGIDVSQTDPSIFSETVLALRFKYNPSGHAYIQGVVNDGQAGDPNHSHGTRVRFGSNDGLFYGLEMGETSSSDETKTAYHKLALGLWFHTREYEDVQGGSRDDNNGVYLIGESSIYREDDEEQGFGVFFQTGYASKRKNQVEWYLGGGFQYVGALEGRDKDILAFGLANARNGETFLSESDGSFKRTETAIELTYVAKVLPYLSLQPSVQWVINPGSKQSAEDILLGIFRIQIAM